VPRPFLESSRRLGRLCWSVSRKQVWCCVCRHQGQLCRRHLIAAIAVIPLRCRIQIRSSHAEILGRLACAYSGETVTQFHTDSSRTDSPVRILYAQPASPSLTRTETDRAQNAAICRRFAHKHLSLRVRKLATEVGFQCPVSEGDILVSRFLERALLRPHVMVAHPEVSP
jgi:hypothetical protein